MIGFFVGAFFAGIVLAIIFGAFRLEAEEKAYRRGYADGRMEVKRKNEETKQ